MADLTRIEKQLDLIIAQLDVLLKLLREQK